MALSFEWFGRFQPVIVLLVCSWCLSGDYFYTKSILSPTLLIKVKQLLLEALPVFL